MADPLVQIVEHVRAVTGLEVFVQRLPDTPDDAVALSWVPGADVAYVMNAAPPVLVRSAVHVRGRSTTYPAAYALAEQVMLELESGGPILCGDWRLTRAYRAALPALNLVDDDGRQIVSVQVELELVGV